MKIKINFLPLSILIVVFLHSTLYSQGLAERKWANSAKIELISADNYETTIKVSISDFDMNDVQTQRGIAKKLILKNAYPFIEKDAPELLKVSVSVAIPFGAEMEAEVISKQYTDFQNILVAPSKGNLTRDINPSSVPYNFGKIYQLNEFYPNKLTELQSPYIMRDITGQALSVYPFQYNPQTKVLRVFNELIIKIKPSSSSNILASNKQINKVDSEFEKIYLKHFINYPFLKTKYTPVSENGKMLIICPDMFMSAIQPLVDWRRISGTPTEVVDISTIGATTTAIKNYISNYYNTNGLTYVILVGDAPQIPTFTVSGGGSDNTYSYLVGNDHYPDIFVGRISAENITHVQTQVQKILSYEIYPQSNDGWLNRGIGIASQEGPGDNNEYDYQHVRSMRQDLLNYEYVSMSELYEGNQGGMDANGDPTAAMVSDEVNNGASIILYTGHGSNTSWGTTGFSNTNINSLTNYNKWPFIWAVACVNGNFTSTTCFAEAWLRATNNGQPTGAIATLMSTINQSWNPPMCGQDEMVDILTEQVNGNIKRSFGAISMHGCMKMNDVYGTQGDEMTDTWNIFGDPSLFVRTDTAKTMNISHSNIALLGATSVQIQCNTNDAKVTLSINGNAIASEFVVNNNAVLNFSPLTQLDSIKVALRGITQLQGRVLETYGIGSQLGGKLLASITAIPTLTSPPPVVNNGAEYPYQIPYPNWVKVDLRQFKLTADKSFVVQFPVGAAYPATNRVMCTYYPSDASYHSFAYQSTNNPPRWVYYSVSGRDGYIFLFLIRAYVSSPGTNIEGPIEILPSAFSLEQNYPNPFNPETIISYSLPKQSRVQIKIFDITGKEIRTLIDEERAAGKYNILWDSRNNLGQKVSSGIYIYKIIADNFVQTKKMVLAK